MFPASIAGLPGNNAWVRVRPPLSASGPSLGSAEGMDAPQLKPGHCRLLPPFARTPEQLGAPKPLAMIELKAVTVPEMIARFPPEAVAGAEFGQLPPAMLLFELTVQLTNCMFPLSW